MMSGLNEVANERVRIKYFCTEILLFSIVYLSKISFLRCMNTCLWPLIESNVIMYWALALIGWSKQGFCLNDFAVFSMEYRKQVCIADLLRMLIMRVKMFLKYLVRVQLTLILSIAGNLSDHHSERLKAGSVSAEELCLFLQDDKHAEKNER